MIEKYYSHARTEDFAQELTKFKKKSRGKAGTAP
jgi:hypothetical protein